MIRLINELKNKIRLMVGKCIIEAAKNASKGVEANIVLLGSERHSGVRMMQHYGFASVPNGGSEGVALFVGGSRDHGVLVASQGEASKIPTLEPGEVALFSEFGQTILLKKDGSILAVPKSGKPYKIDADLEVTGDVKVFCDASAAYITMSGHIHPTPAGDSSPAQPGN